MTSIDAHTFLETVQGFARAQTEREKGSGLIAPRLATIDPTYVTGSGLLPKVTFDGESTLSGKRYPWYGNYMPHAGDRVVMLPVGNTFWIIGCVNNPGGQGFYQDASGDTYRLYLSNLVYLQVQFGTVLSVSVDGRKLALPRCAYLQADDSPGVNNSTVVRTSPLKLYCVNNVNYHFQARLKYTAGTTEDFVPSLVLPTGATFDYMPMSIESGDTDAVGQVFMGTKASDLGGGAQDSRAAGINSSTPSNMWVVGMIYMGSTAGDSAVGYTQGTAGSGTTTLLRKGSSLVIFEATGVG